MDFPNAQLPQLVPLKNSFAVNGIEDDLRNMFIDLFEEMLAEQAFEANVLGMGHLASLSLIRKLELLYSRRTTKSNSPRNTALWS